MKINLKGNNTELSAIVFDLGNVLLAYEPARFMFDLGIPPQKIPRLIEIIDGRPEYSEYDRGVLSKDDIIRLAVRDEPSMRSEIIHYMKHRAECFTAIIPNVELLCRAKEAGLKTYLLSDCSEGDYAYFRDHFIFLHDLDGEIISGACKITKPNPGIFEELLKTYPEIDPSHTLFVDDREKNTAAGAKMGFITLNLPAGGTIEDYLEFNEEK